MRKLLVGFVCIVSIGAGAGPLGLNKGMSLEELNKQGTFKPVDQQGVYRSKTLTNGHPDFEYYSVFLTPEQGLCKIIASSNNIETSSYGTELDGKFKDLTSALIRKYGPPGSKFDFLRSRSIWNEPKDWMMGLLKKERTLSFYWTHPEISNLPDSLKSISVEAIALSANLGYLRLVYDFNNISECLESSNAKKNSNL